MQEYRVTWEIDVYANSPREAASAALEIQRRAGSSAVVFDVIGPSDEIARIDLDEPETLPDELNGYQVRHDINGWYICSDDEAAREDEGNPSAGLDGRDHWSTIDLAREALQEIAND